MSRNYSCGNYQIEVIEDSLYALNSVDNVRQYDEIYLDEDSYTVFGIRVLRDNLKVKSAIIGSNQGATTLHDTAMVIEDDRLVICCSDSIFSLSIPSLSLLWRTRADFSTCFEIFQHKDCYIIHGELTISMIDRNGHILWQHGGRDIFTTVDGRDDFTITNDYILATDWNNEKYKFDFNGNIIK